MSTLIEGTDYLHCDRHHTVYLPNQTCPRCAAEQAPIVMSALPAGAFAFCPDHDILYHIAIGVRCPLCLAEQAAAQRREIINVLQSRIADHDQALADLRDENRDLRRRVLELEKRR